jgi:hypothetical protein
MVSVFDLDLLRLKLKETFLYVFLHCFICRLLDSILCVAEPRRMLEWIDSASLRRLAGQPVLLYVFKGPRN